MSRKITMTYGDMPSDTLLEQLFEEQCSDGRFSFANDKRVGTARLSFTQLLEAFDRAIVDSEEDDEALHWVSSVLSCLGVEWV